MDDYIEKKLNAIKLNIEQIEIYLKTKNLANGPALVKVNDVSKKETTNNNLIDFKKERTNERK